MIKVQRLFHSFAGKEIFSGLDWEIKNGFKYGLVGPNGAGKTTLLEIIAGLRTPERGSVEVPRNTTIGYLPQETGQTMEDNTIVYEALKGLPDVYDDEAHPDTLRYMAEKILMGLGFTVSQLDHKTSTLSGGWKMRVELAKILLADPDVLLLDEPTNHLDIQSIEWVEGYLKGFTGSVVIVSHDKYLLDRMSDTIAELETGIVTEYRGNYSDFLVEKEKMREIQRSTYKNQQKKIRETERFIERFRYKNTKARQVQSRIKMLEKMEKAELPVEDRRTISLRFPESPRSGKIVFELSAFSKSYRSGNGVVNNVFDNAGPLIVERGDKIALAGKNGEGKSTLARIIVGTEEFSGERKLGHNVRLAYFAQNQTETLRFENTVTGEMERTAPGLSYTEIRNILGSFLFGDEDVDKKVSVLSGGEKSRLALSMMLVSPSNFLILDEPTNHLDMQSKDILLRALREYSGSFILISHDRYFIDQLVNKVWYVEGGGIEIYQGNYSRFVEKYRSNKDAEPGENAGKYRSGATESNDRAGSKTAEAEERKRLYRELKEKGLENMTNWRMLTHNQLSSAVRELEERIVELETEKERYQSLFDDPGFFDDVEESAEKTREFERINSRLSNMYRRWEEVADYLSGKT